MLRLSCIAALVSSIWLGAAAAQDLTGTIRVVDGDTFAVAGQTIRIFGIDAPETDQMCGGSGTPMWGCGAWVSGEVRARFGGRRARCETVDVDRYQRIVARCYVDGADVGKSLVAEGLAFAFRKYSWDYDLDEKGAAVTGRGLHGQGVENPAAFRANARAGHAAQSMQQAPDGCVIKGNISADGKRIYHVPGQSWYARTVVKTSDGERWFCSEAEARQAGWRRARR